MFAMDYLLMWNFIRNSRSTPIWFQDRWPPFVNIHNFSSELRFTTYFAKYSFCRTLADEQLSRSTQLLLIGSFCWILFCEKKLMNWMKHVPVRPTSGQLYVRWPGLRRLYHIEFKVVLSLSGIKVALYSVPPFCLVKVCHMRYLFCRPPLPLQVS